MQTQADKTETYPSSFYGWYVTILLTLVYILSFVDRQIIGLLFEPMKADLNLSDSQLGLLSGLAFAIFYGTMGLPLGWLADRMKRTYLLGIGVTIWSMATVISGFAGQYKTLFTARILVGAGEATLGPCAVSLISDVMPPRRRARAIAVYSSALSFAIGIAYLLGGQVLHYANTLDLSAVPIIGDRQPWQLVFIAVGLPGFLFTILLLLLREPKRLERTNINKDEQHSFRYTLRYFRKHWKLFGSLFILPIMMTITSYSHNFIPSLFSRVYDWDAVTLSKYLGTLVLILGPLSTIFGGYLIDMLHNRGRRDGGIFIMMMGAVIMIPASTLFPIMPTPQLALMTYGVTLIGMTILTSAAIPCILQIVPAELRGQATAIYLMTISIFGLVVGPTLVGVFTDYLFRDPLKIHYSMALVPGMFGVIGLALIPVIIRQYRKAVLS